MAVIVDGFSGRKKQLERLHDSQNCIDRLDFLSYQLAKEAEKAGIPMADQEFHCRGEFKGVHKGRPNEEDLKAAAAFAKSFMEG